MGISDRSHSYLDGEKDFTGVLSHKAVLTIRSFSSTGFEICLGNPAVKSFIDSFLTPPVVIDGLSFCRGELC